MHGTNPGRIVYGLIAMAVPAAFGLFGLIIAAKQVLRKFFEDRREKLREKKSRADSRNDSRGF